MFIGQAGPVDIEQEELSSVLLRQNMVYKHNYYLKIIIWQFRMMGEQKLR
jgi:hypothetical protein